MLLFLLLSGALAAHGAAPQGAGPGITSYVPQRVYNTKSGTWTDFETMAADLAKAGAVFVGEQHGDPNTHALERALLEALARRRADIVVSMEFFERDAQAVLDRYLAGTVEEAVFVKEGRAPSRYPTDYKPIIELAKERKWPVLAANIPRPMAAEVAKAGLDVLKTMPEAQKQWLPADITCALDGYYERFVKAMGAHPGAATEADQKNIRYYYAQCLKDEAMGESVARAAKGPVVVHFNGAFHSDFGLGAAERARRRMSGSRVAIVTMLPVASLDGIEPSAEDRARADYLVYTLTSKRSQ